MVSLEGELESFWTQLSRATCDGKHSFRKLWLATVDDAGFPQVRLVVLRRFEKASREFEIYTDPRTPKWAELRQRPIAQVNFWDAKASLQVRCDCGVELIESGAHWEQARKSLPEHVAGDYAAVEVPGDEIGEPEEGWRVGEEWSFGIVRLRIQKMDWLKLSREGHRRARFDWTGGAFRGTWVQP